MFAGVEGMYKLMVQWSYEIQNAGNKCRATSLIHLAQHTNQEVKPDTRIPDNNC